MDVIHIHRRLRQPGKTQSENEITMAQWEGLELMVTRQVWRTSDGHSGKLSEVNLGDGHGWRSVAPVLHDLGIQV